LAVNLDQAKPKLVIFII